MASVIAVLDANVLFPASLRDTLVRAGQRDLYQMHWTSEILEEVRRNLVKTGRVKTEKAQKLVDTLNNVFPRALVSENYQMLIPLMQNDPKDRHVLAAAVACQAQIIVTNNLQDFPEHALAPYDIAAQAPDMFLMQLFKDDANAIAQIIAEQVAELHNPPQTVAQELEQLAHVVPAFAQAMRDYLAP